MMQKCIGNMKYEIHHLIEITFQITLNPSNHNKNYHFILQIYRRSISVQANNNTYSCVVIEVIINVQLIRYHYH